MRNAVPMGRNASWYYSCRSHASVDAAPNIGQDRQCNHWAMLEERRGEEETLCVAMYLCTMTAIPCGGTDLYGSVAPVGGCRLSLSIAAPDQILLSHPVQR